MKIESKTEQFFLNHQEQESVENYKLRIRNFLKTDHDPKMGQVEDTNTIFNTSTTNKIDKFIKKLQKNAQNDAIGFTDPKQPIRTCVTYKVKELEYFKLLKSTKLPENISKYPVLQKIKNCNSKTQLKKVMEKLPKIWKSYFRVFLDTSYISMVANSKVTDYEIFLNSRTKLDQIVEDANTLTFDCNFDNNLVKNFTAAFARFMLSNKQAVDIYLKNAVL